MNSDNVGGGGGIRFGGGKLNRFVCTRWVNGVCPFSDLTCPLAHSKDRAPLCKAWVHGYCIGGRGNSCRLRHYYNETDRLPQGSKDQEPAADSTLTEFSSPLVVKVKKFTEQHHRVEVDLETGRRKSWMETEEKEIIDLCGETPAKKRPMPTFANSDKKQQLEQSAQQKSQLRSLLKDISNTLAQPSSGSKKPAPEVAGLCTRCNKQFSGEKGLKMHLARSSCGKAEEQDLLTLVTMEVTPPPGSQLRSDLLPVGPDDSCIILD